MRWRCYNIRRETKSFKLLLLVYLVYTSPPPPHPRLRDSALYTDVFPTPAPVPSYHPDIIITTTLVGPPDHAISVLIGPLLSEPPPFGK